MNGRKMFSIFVCVLMISAAMFVAVSNIVNERVTVDDILDSNANDIIRVSSVSDLNDLSYGDVILVESNHENTVEFNERLNGAATACYPVISVSGYGIFSDANLSAVYPNDAMFVGYCKDPDTGEDHCKAIIGSSDADSVKGLCEWANGYADKTVRILNSTYGILEVAKYIFRVITEDQSGNDSVSGNEQETLGKSTISSTDYDTGHGMLSIRTTYTEYSEDDSRRYFRVSYIVESVPWKAGDQYRTADIKIISGIGGEGSNQRLESYQYYSINDVAIHDVHEGDHYEIWYDIDENTILGSSTYMVQPQIEISTDKSVDGGSLKIIDVYKVNYCKYGNGGGDWWRIFHMDKCHSFEYFSTDLYVGIV